MAKKKNTKWRRRMLAVNAPKKLWDEFESLMVTDDYKLTWTEAMRILMQQAVNRKRINY